VRKRKNKATDKSSSASHSEDEHVKNASKEEITEEVSSTTSASSPSSSPSPSPTAADAPTAAAPPPSGESQLSLSFETYSLLLFLVAMATRVYKLDTPRGIVFDELHYGKYASYYLKNTFFFDSQPPLGKQLIAAAGWLVGYDASADHKFERIGAAYAAGFPVVALRLACAFFGALVPPTAYLLLRELRLRRGAGLLGGALLILDNALVVQTRFILLEGPLLFFGLLGLLCVVRLRRYRDHAFGARWWGCLVLGAASLTGAACVRYFGLFTLLLGALVLCHDWWALVPDRALSHRALMGHLASRAAVFVAVPVAVYLAVFYLHLNILYRAGPNDPVMSSAFQTTLEGGLAAIIANQPKQIAHGSEITIRHSIGSTCWLHSHPDLYPKKYPDDRGSSHQQQVTCYSYKDTNNWWIVKKPDVEETVVTEPLQPIEDGDVVQLVHGMTRRALNSHDVASAMSPHSQEVTCYVDHNVSMPAQDHWRVKLLNPAKTEGRWHAIYSQVQLQHETTGTFMRFSGRHLPAWAHNQHEVVADREQTSDDTHWNVEEHRYARSEDPKERERERLSVEMIPPHAVNLTFWEKLYELQYKMIFNNQENVAGHMYASDPLDWLTLKRGVAYWVAKDSNAQIHLVGNSLLWLSGTAALVGWAALLLFYVMRRARHCYDIPDEGFDQFCAVGLVLGGGYLVHYLPYFLVDRTLFLHHYIPAYVFKVLLLAALLDHLHYALRTVAHRVIAHAYALCVLAWLAGVAYVFVVFAPLTYGHVALTGAKLDQLDWRGTWDLIKVVD